MALTLDSPVSAIDAKLTNRRMRQKGEPASVVLAGIGIDTVRHLLHHYPRRYIDRSRVSRIRDLKVGEEATVIARVRRVNKRPMRNRRFMVTVTIYDGSATLDLTFFNQPWIASMYHDGDEVAVSGTAQSYKGRLQFANQEIEFLRGDEQDLVHTGRILPVHRATDGVATRTIRELIWRALQQIRRLEDPLPERLVAQEALQPFDQALRRIHFPESPEDLDAARERLKFDELFTLELGVAFRKHRVERAEEGIGHAPVGELVERFGAVLPFEPTGAQERAIAEIDEAMARSRPMNVLFGQDARRRARGARRGPVRPPSGDHGADRGPRRAASPLGHGAARTVRRRAVPRPRRRHRGRLERRAVLAARARAAGRPTGDVRDAHRIGYGEGPAARPRGDRDGRG
jgi:RecG-like helicase